MPPSERQSRSRSPSTCQTNKKLGTSFFRTWANASPSSLTSLDRSSFYCSYRNKIYNVWVLYDSNQNNHHQTDPLKAVKNASKSQWGSAIAWEYVRQDTSQFRPTLPASSHNNACIAEPRIGARRQARQETRHWYSEEERRRSALGGELTTCTNQTVSHATEMKLLK